MPQQQTLNGELIEDKDLIKSISYDQDEIIKWIMTLYCPDGFELDTTFRKIAIFIFSIIAISSFAFSIIFLITSLILRSKPFLLLSFSYFIISVGSFIFLHFYTNKNEPRRSRVSSPNS